MSQIALKLVLDMGRQQNLYGEEASEPFSTDEVAHLQGAIEQQLGAVLLRNEKLEQLNACFEAALNHMGRGLSMFDSEQRLVVCNKAYADIYELPGELTRPGTPFVEILRFHMHRATGENASKEKASEWIKDHVARLQQTGHREEIQNLSDGRIIRVTYQPLSGGGWVDMQEDITDQRRLDEKIEWLARHDTLTEIPNRFHFRERLEHQFETYDPRQGFALLWIDLDHFKEINDRLGHLVGDGLLRSIAARLKSSLRAGDVVGRLGGDEFAILQVGVDREDLADNLARRVLQNIRRPHDVLGHCLHTEASIGVAMAPHHGQTPEQLFACADMALYRAKSMGRGVHAVYTPGSVNSPAAPNPLRAELQAAVEHDELVLHYQPIVDLREGKVSSFEALMRWKHPSRGMIPPSEFIPIAEETRLIVRMGSWALKQACTDAMDWPEDTKVAVNLSAVQIECCDVFEIVTEALRETGLPPQRLQLEITETVLMRDQRADAGGAAQAARSRRPDHAGRLRNVLRDAQLSAQLPVQEDQDRPQLRARHSRAPRLRRHRQVRGRSRTRAEHALGCRGRRDFGQSGGRACRRVQRGAGVLFQPARACQRREARREAVHTATCGGR